MSEPKRTAEELATALRHRALLLTGEKWEAPATVAMMHEAAEMLLRQVRAVHAHDALVAALREFVAHYPHGVNPYLDEAWMKAEAALALVEKADG